MNTIKAVRCHYCDQLHQVTKADCVQRQGRLYYVRVCPVVQLPLTVAADQAFTIR